MDIFSVLQWGAMSKKCLVVVAAAEDLLARGPEQQGVLVLGHVGAHASRVHQRRVFVDNAIRHKLVEG